MRQVLRWPNPMTLCFVPLILSGIVLTPNPTQALTASFGQPYHGRLVNGIPFPRQFSGYQLRDEGRTYTTPEVIGAMLDAVDAVQKQFPGTPNLYLGDFSLPGGGPINNHRSHQNGRDVDVGMYAKGNRTMDSFAPMNEENLDVPRTWAFVESLLCSQRVQYIFVDQRIQNLLVEYARSRGIDASYLDRLFANNRGAVIQHVRNHVDHIHVRFYTPWSTMAAQVGDLDEQKRAVVEMAQQSYLPKKVFYYAKGNEKSLDALAQSFGVHRNDLCRWNEIRGAEILSPGKCLVFYKRGFEFEPVHLAQSLQPDSVPEAPAYQFAAIRPSSSSASDAGSPTRERTQQSREKKSSEPVTFTYKAKRGDTIEKIARRNGVDAGALARANGVKPGSALQPGRKIKLAGLKIPAGSNSCEVTGGRKRTKAKSAPVIASVSSKPAAQAKKTKTAASERVSASKGGKETSAKGLQNTAGSKMDSSKSAVHVSKSRKADGITPAKAGAASTASEMSKKPAADAKAAPKGKKSSPAQSTGSKATTAKTNSPANPSAVKSVALAGIAKNTKSSNK